MVYVCTFVSSYLATKDNNRLLKVCGLLESRPVINSYQTCCIPLIGVHLTITYPTCILSYYRTCTQGVQYSISKIDVYRNSVLENAYCKGLDACIV